MSKHGYQHCLGIMVCALVLSFIAASSAGQDSREASPAVRQIRYSEISSSAGIRINPSVGGHGVAFADVDGDGLLDFYVTNTPSTPNNVPNYLFMNRGDGTFVQQSGLRGVMDTDSAIGNVLGSHGAVFADFNRDGAYDLVLGNAGHSTRGQSRFFLNDGSGSFDDATKSSGFYGTNYFTRGIAVADFDRDGYLDVIQTNTYSGEMDPAAEPQKTTRVYWGGKSGIFAPDSKTGMLDYGFVQGITATDINGDGKMDVIESHWPDLTADARSNVLWINNGNGTFRDASLSVGLSFAFDDNRYNGPTAADMDNDGDPDIIVIGKIVRYYRNDGKLNFTELTNTGLDGDAYCAAVGDMDNDGDLDIFIPHSNGGFGVYRNDGNHKYTRINNSGIKPAVFNDPRAAAFGDIDNDGDLDLAIANKNNYVQLFRNEANSRSYVTLTLTGPGGEAAAPGAKIWIYKKGMLKKKDGLLAYRESTSGYSYLCQNDPRIHIGLPENSKRFDILIRHFAAKTLKVKNAKRSKRYEFTLKPRKKKSDEDSPSMIY